ncbi:MAG: M20/M25/M40 family metallo-hydrolase [Rhabdochlamydiaceae bacterium]
MNKYEYWFKDNKSNILADYFHFLRFPTVSSDSKAFLAMKNCVNWLEAFLSGMGLKVEIWKTDGWPVIFAEFKSEAIDAPTVLIYHHYDVQPVDPLHLWDQDPFEPYLKDGYVYARGALDNKGQCFYSLSALKAFLSLNPRPSFNIKILIEGEEESGTENTSKIIGQKVESLKADHVLIVDMDLKEEGVPTITLGLRGMIGLEIECINSFFDLHSGTHGGIALNPNKVLVDLLAKLWNEDGSIAIEGFYESIQSCSYFKELDHDFDRSAYSRTFGVKAFHYKENVSPSEANWLLPTIEINGLHGGYGGEGMKTVIPKKAVAKLSCRLVPGQNPDKIAESVKNFLLKNVPSGIDLNIIIHKGGQAYRGKKEHPFISLVANAYETVFSRPCCYVLSGASVPIVSQLNQVTEGECVLIGCGLASDNIHSPNERFSLSRFEQGFYLISNIMESLEKS